jgi:hypothetical protein
LVHLEAPHRIRMEIRKRCHPPGLRGFSCTTSRKGRKTCKIPTMWERIQKLQQAFGFAKLERME